MKTLLLSFSFVLFSGLAFGQTSEQKMIMERLNSQMKMNTYRDLTKEEAFKKFEESNIRQALGIQMREFNYENIVYYAYKLNTPISQMLIMKSTNNKTLIDQLKGLYQWAGDARYNEQIFYFPYKSTLQLNP